MYSDMLSKYKKAIQEQSARNSRWLPSFSGVKIPRLIPSLIRIIRHQKQHARLRRIKKRIKTYWV